MDRDVMVFNINVYCVPPITYIDATLQRRGTGRRASRRSTSWEITLDSGQRISSENLVDQVLSDINNPLRRRAVYPVRVSSRALDIINFDYAEKLVTGLEMSFPLYHLGLRPYTPWMGSATAIPTATGVRYPLIQKYFSGDVSGVIGESLFVYIATKVFKVSDLSIIHLRPMKGNMLTPDFVVRNPQDISKLSPLLCLDSSNVSKDAKLFVECKASASRQVSRKRIAKGLSQLFAVLNRGDLGLLFLVQREGQGQPLSIVSIPLIRR